MVTCDVFDLQVDVIEDRLLQYEFHTDLPAGTRVIVVCTRDYEDMRGEGRVWRGYSSMVELRAPISGPLFGQKGIIDVRLSDQKGLNLFREIRGSSKIRTPVGDDLTLALTVGARQRHRAFGRYNCDLSGKKVENSGGINVVEVRCSVKLPMDGDLQPRIAR